MKRDRLFLGIFFSVVFITLSAQNKTISAIVTDSVTNRPLPFSTVINADDYFKVITNNDGRFSITSSSDSPHLIISYIGYQTLEIIANNATDSIKLVPQSYKLKEVTVSGIELSGLQNSTLIENSALSYLQAAGLKDAFQLLPGNLTENPDLSEFNEPLIREIDYNTTSSMGTALIIDGNTISNNASMQLITSSYSYLNDEYPFAKGNDLRQFSTDNIESINIIKGIPSAQYGDVTNAIIEVKTNLYELNTSAKVQYSSSLFSSGVSKGYKINDNHNIGGNIYYTSYTYDVRTPLLKYNRINIALGSRHRIADNKLLTTNLKGYYTLNRNKYDPEIQDEDEEYKEYNQGIKSNITFLITNTNKFINRIEAILNVNIDKECISESIHNNSGEVVTFSSSTVTGENFGTYAPSNVFTKYSITGLPYSFHLNTKMNISKAFKGIKTNTLLGVESKYEKNAGKGLEFPSGFLPIIGKTSFRNVKYSAIPALISGGLYIDEKINKSFGRNKLEIQTGLRYSYYTPDKNEIKSYPEPRINSLYIYNITPNTSVMLHAGYGIQYKIPIMRYLHPDMAWFDMISYNYYNTENSGESYLVYLTSNTSTKNNNLQPSRSEKMEIGITLKTNFLNAVFTAFKELHSNGIILTDNYTNVTYKAYDTSVPIDYNKLPGEQNIPYANKEYYLYYLYPQNTKSTLKEGIEYSIGTKKIDYLQTRLNLSGAWFKTKTIINSSPYYYLPVSNNTDQYNFIGVYSGGNGKLSERLSSNLRIITHIPSLSLVTSVSVQTIWLYKYQFIRADMVPTELIDRDGNVIEFTSEMANDASFINYIQIPSSTYYIKEEFPVMSQVNLKLSKEIGNHVKVSFLANNILNSRPLVKQKISNTYIRMNSPLYFGLDLEIKF